MYIPISQSKKTNQPVSQGYIPISQGQPDISNVSKRYTPISQGSVTPKIDSSVTPKQSQPLPISFDFSDEIKNQTAMSTPQIGTGVDTLGAIKKTAQFGAEALQMSARGFLSAGLTIAKKINPEVANLTTEDLQRTVGQFYEKKPGYLSLGLDTEQRELFGESLFETVFGKKEEVDKWAKPLEDVIADTELKLKDWQSQLIEQTKQAKLNPIEKTVIDTLVNVNPNILAFPAVMGSLGLDMFPVGSLEKNVVKTIIKTTTEKEALIFTKRIGLVAEDAMKIAPKIVEADTVEKANEVIKQIYLLAKDRNISIPEIRDFETALQKVQTPSQVTRIAEGESEIIPISKINTATEDFTIALKGVDTKTELPKSKLPVLVKKMSDGTYDILDGNHRLAQAIRQGKTDILAITDENIYRQLADKESQFAYKKIPQVIYNELSNISKSIKLSELAGTSEEKYQEVKIAIELAKESIEQLPGKQLMKYVSKTTGRLPEVTGQKTMRSLTGSEKLVKRGRFGQMGDELVTELGFNNLDEAQEGLEIYQNAKRRLAQLEDTAKQLRVEKSNVKKGERLMQLAMEDRRIAYRAVKNAFDLTESELSKIRQGRDIMAMSKKEFDQFIERAQTLAQTLQQTREARIGLETTIHELDLKKWENVREAMKLPPISEMNVEQINKLNDILSKYKTGDEFLPVRQLETIDQTELKGIRTTREALEHLAKKYNLTVEQLPREIKPHPWMYDTQLARSHPLFDLLVNKYNESYLKAGGRTIELERKADDLIKKARNSVPKGIGEMVAPTDKKIIEWLESENRQIVAREMTSEQLQAAEYMDSVYKEYYDWLSKRELEKKFVTRFEDKYFPHIQRGFLETWKEDGFLKAFKQSFDEFKNNEKYLTILDEKTGNILPYQKWVGFTQFRKGGLVPTQNASKAFKAYVTALEKARQFDEFIPEIMVYVHSLTPKGLTPRGIELNDSVNRFIKTWINSKKGRVEKQIVTPGSKLDWALRMGVALTRIRDLGLNVPVGIANIFGEQAGNLTMLGAKNYALGLSRLATKRGREIITKYPEFVGRSVFEKLSEASNTIGDKLLTGLFGLFSQASRKGNQVFLLGSMTADEFSKGVISVERLAQLRKAMGKYRVVEGSESVFGKTVEGAIGGQYKRFAIPILVSTFDNARQFTSLIKTKGVKVALSSKEGSELFYSVVLGSTLGLGIMGYYNELSTKKDRSFVEDIIFKSTRDSLSMIGALDPKFIGSFAAPRLASFIVDLSTGIDDLLSMQKYKTTGELKGIAELERTLTPTLISNLVKDKKTTTTTKTTTKKSTPRVKIPSRLPQLPSLEERLPKLPKLPKLKI